MSQITRKYHLFDARDKVLGRLAGEIARLLSGKHRVDYTPNIDGGDFVVVVNIEHIRVTGDKELKKEYHRYTGYPGGIKSLRYEEVKEKDVRKILQSAVRGMLAKNKLQSDRMKRLFLYEGEKHPHTIHITHE
jgi:large subunit ribosomal protein L13